MVSTVSSSLCTICSSIDFDKALCSPEHGGATHHPHILSLATSAATGCPLCSGILGKLEEAYGSKTVPAPLFCNVWNWSDGTEDASRGSACIVFYSRPEQSVDSWAIRLGIFVDEGNYFNQHISSSWVTEF